MSTDKTALSMFLKDLYNVEPLSIEREVELSEQIRGGDLEAIDELVTHNLRYVVSLVKNTPASQYGRVDLEDLIAAGYESMIKAAEKWIPQKGIKFIGYAKPYIDRAVMRCIENTANIIRLPVNIGEDIRRLKYNERMLLQKLGRQPTVQELADELGIESKRVHELRGYLLREPKSLDAINSEHVEPEEE